MRLSVPLYSQRYPSRGRLFVLAFYDSVAANYQQIYGEEFLGDLIHDVVQTIKRNLKVEWTDRTARM